MLQAAIIAVLVSIGMVLLRGLVGKTLYDRILAVNVLGTHTVILIALLSILMGNSSFLDIALIYALINFITTIALLRYFRVRTFGAHGGNNEEEK